MSYHVGISTVREPKLREEKSFPGPHSLGVLVSELEPSTWGSEASALFTTLPLEQMSLEQKHGQESLSVCHFQSSASSWRVFPTHLVGDRLYGDLVPLFRLDLTSDKALLIVFDPAGPLDVIGLVHGFNLLLVRRCQEGHWVHIVPTFAFIPTGHCGLVEGEARRNQGREPGLP